MSEYINEPIKITDIEDHEDGSATLKLELDPETYAAIFNAGFIHLVMKGIESEENND
tara:strand:+ start:512 stop:682 length:171 start_codon:yes stop_codon:yes gene_type:complete